MAPDPVAHYPVTDRADAYVQVCACGKSFDVRFVTFGGRSFEQAWEGPERDKYRTKNRNRLLAHVARTGKKRAKP